MTAKKMDPGEMSSWFNAEFWHKIVRDTLDWAVHALPKVGVVLILAYVLLKVLDAVCKRLAAHAMEQAEEDDLSSAREHQKRAETLIGIIRKTGFVVIWAMVIVLVLMQVGVNVAPLLAGAGVVGLAVGFGAQELVRDVITGLFILLENHIRKGDVAIINGTGGLVESIGLRTIELRDLAGVLHIFQNGKISSLSNMTHKWSAMVFDVGVAYKEDTDRVSAIMVEICEEMRGEDEFKKKIIEPMEMFGVDAFRDSAVIVKARIKTLPIEQWVVGREYNRRLKKRFDQEGIEIPFPHRTLYWGEASQPFQVESKAPNQTASK